MAILIGASSESISSIKKAKESGLKVIAFDGNKNAEGLKFADFSYVLDIRDPKNIIDIMEKWIKLFGGGEAHFSFAYTNW